MKALIADSYDLDERQIVDVPKSSESETYDITAKPEKEGGFTPAEGKITGPESVCHGSRRWVAKNGSGPACDRQDWSRRKI